MSYYGYKPTFWEKFLNVLWKLLGLTAAVSVLLFVAYMLCGTEGNVEEIKRRAPQSIADRGWKILRYEGYERGAFGDHGGRVWYHVADVNDRTIQYRVYITLYNNELHYYYGGPETLQRVNVQIDK